MHEPPGHRYEPISHRGEELFYILAGTVTVEIEGEKHVLAEGDSIHFDSYRTHSSWNHGSETASFLWCGTMDVFGAASAETDPFHKKRDSEAREASRGDLGNCRVGSLRVLLPLHHPQPMAGRICTTAHPDERQLG